MQVLGVRITYRDGEEFSGDFLYYEVVNNTIMQDIAHIKSASIICYY